MAVEDAAEGFLGSDLLLGGMWDSIIKTDKEKAAEEARRKAAEQAQDALDFNKAVYEENRGTVDDLGRDLFGPDLQTLAQQNADDRARLAAQGGFQGTTDSGRKGIFNFGNGSGPSSTGAPASTPAPAPQEYTWDANGNKVPVPTGFRDNLTGVGVPAPASTTTPATAPAAPTSNPITAADRELAERQAQEAHKKTLPGQLDTSRQHYKNVVDQFISDVDGIAPVSAGEYDDSWNVDDKQDYISPEARAAQKAAMDKTLALTDTKETAEEKLMREISRRSQERDLRAAREAQASELRTRGAYGSGAELSGFLGAQQELAQRRSLEEMAANANAQKRAMAAIGQYGDQAFQLGQQDTTVGGLRDLNTRFNSTSKQNFRQFKTKTEQEEAERLAKIAASKADAGIGLANRERDDANTVADTKIRLAGAKTGTNLSSAQPVNSSRSDLAGAFKTKALELDADDAASKWGIF